MTNLTNNETAISLIIDELDGNLSDPDKKIELQKWIEASPENKLIYKEFCQINEGLDTLAVYETLDPNASWLALEQKLEPSSKRITTYSNKWWLAAAAILIAVMSMPLYRLINPNQITVNTAANEHKTIQLSDGSYFTLNENSTVQYNRNNSKTTEVALLKGEVFFNIIHNPARIFKVNLGDVNITDIGTSFNVKRTLNEISVIVATGKIAFGTVASRKTLLLHAGKKGTYTITDKRLVDSYNIDKNYRAWLNRKLSFINTPLSEVAERLERAYGTKVVLGNSSLQKRKLNASLNYQTIDSALAVISSTLQIKVSKQDNGYVLETLK